MKNGFFDIFKSKVDVKIQGKNIDRFLHKLVHLKIQLLDVVYLRPNEVKVRVYAADYEKMQEIKTIYEMETLDSHGTLKFKKVLSTYRYLLFFMIFGCCFLFFLSRIIFEIEIVHTDKALRELLGKEMEAHGLSLYHFRRSYEELQTIKKDILEKHKTDIEWLEIETVGTKYVVRVEARKLPEEKPVFKKQNVVAKKEAIIKRVEAKSGEIIRNVNDYVKAGDVVISGEIKLNEETKGTIKAEGTIYGEVWYFVKVEYPYVYQEEKTTSKRRNAFVLHFLNQEFDLWPFSKFSDKKVLASRTLKHSFLPIWFGYERQQEVKRIEEVNTAEEAMNRALELATEKMKSKLNDKEKIIDRKSLKVDMKESKIVMEVFFTVYEDITDYQEIQNLPEEKPE